MMGHGLLFVVDKIHARRWKEDTSKELNQTHDIGQRRDRLVGAGIACIVVQAPQVYQFAHR
jgi:hypothetical protein